jgi:myo-inositol-1(or 4)-monophosphatase
LASLAVQIAERLEKGRQFAQLAGGVLMQHLGRLAGYERKSAIDLVTQADRESEALLAARLGAEYPQDRLVLEEADGAGGAAARHQELTAAPFSWCVDPLDGTTNFVHGFPFFAVSLGLLHFGRPVLGIVHAPALATTWTGGDGIAATENGAPISVSAVDRLAESLLSTGFPYDRRSRIDALLAVVRAALMNAQDLRRAGSAAIDLCYVASGRVEAFFEQGLAPWDVAAGQAIVEAAGGTVTRYDGSPHDPWAREIVGSNGRVHAELGACLARAARSG